MREVDKCLEQVIKTYTNYFQKMLGSVPGVWKKSNDDHYCFIPAVGVSEIINCLFMVRDYIHTKYQHERPLRFLDCGCGIGNIMMAATAVGGYEVHGIEYEEATYKVAQDLLSDDSNIIMGDITTFDNYYYYDVIYYFAPIKCPDKRRRFNEKLANDIRIGSVIISYGGSNYLPHDERFRTLPKTHEAYEKVG